MIAVTLGISAFWTWLAVHDHNLRQEILLEFNTAQDKLLQEKKDEFDRQVKALSDQAADIKKQMEDKDRDLKNVITTIEKNIKAKDGKQQAPLYLKELVNNMQKSFGEKEVKK
jgi:hypothetical protein